MSGAKRYTAEESDSGAWRVMDEDLRDGGPTEVCIATGDSDPFTDEMRRDPREDAARIARLLNAEESVRAALEEAARFVAAVIATEDDPQPGDVETLREVRAALSALDAPAVRP